MFESSKYSIVIGYTNQRRQAVKPWKRRHFFEMFSKAHLGIGRRIFVKLVKAFLARHKDDMDDCEKKSRWQKMLGPALDECGFRNGSWALSNSALCMNNAMKVTLRLT